MKKTVLIYSGGLDSTILLDHLVQQGEEVYGLSIDYGQKHSKELEFAKLNAEKKCAQHSILNLSNISQIFGTSSLTSDSNDIPEGHYEQESMKLTVVPNRNMILLSLATAYAISNECDSVSYAAHSGDHAIYPDCRNEFADAMDQAIQLCDWHKVQLDRPFVDKSKADIVRLGAQLSTDFSQTWSCYKGEQLHCGKCGTCIERREAFHLAQVEDPTKYDAQAPSVESLVKKNWKL